LRSVLFLRYLFAFGSFCSFLSLALLNAYYRSLLSNNFCTALVNNVVFQYGHILMLFWCFLSGGSMNGTWTSPCVSYQDACKQICLAGASGRHQARTIHIPVLDDALEPDRPNFSYIKYPGLILFLQHLNFLHIIRHLFQSCCSVWSSNSQGSPSYSCQQSSIGQILLYCEG